jgi:hypothetical protein
LQIFLGWNATESAITGATKWPILPARDDNDECGAVGGMLGRGNRSTRRKTSPVSLCPPQVPRDLTRARTGAVAVGSRLLIAKFARVSDNSSTVSQKQATYFRQVLVTESSNMVLFSHNVRKLDRLWTALVLSVAERFRHAQDPSDHLAGAMPGHDRLSTALPLMSHLGRDV